MPLTHYSKFSMFMLRIWVFKSGVLKTLFILSKHGTNTNIRSTMMACFMLRIWVFKSGVLKTLFILSKHGTNTNIRSTMMANNRHAYNRDVLQSYWTTDGLPLYCSQPTGEKTHTNHQYERLGKIRQTTGNIWSWRQGIAAFG